MARGKIQSDYQFHQQASLSQQLAHKDPIYEKLAGSDVELSKKIATLLVLCEFGVLDENDPNIKLMLAIYDAWRKAILASKETTDIITKMGLQMAKGASEVDFSDDSER